MRTEKPKGNDCNICVAFKCRKISSEYPRLRTKHKFSAAQLAHMECGGYLCPKPFKVPLLIHLATKPSKIQAMNDLLSIFKFQLAEKERYPFFILKMKKARGKWQKRNG